MTRARVTAVAVAILGVLVVGGWIDAQALVAGIAGLLVPSPLENPPKK